MSTATVTQISRGKRTARVYALSKSRRRYCFNARQFPNYSDFSKFADLIRNNGMKINTNHWIRVN